MTFRSLLLLVATPACVAGSSPLVDSAPQVEVTANPGDVAGQPRFALTLTTWNHLAALRDAVAAGEIAVTLDGELVPLAPAATGDFGEGDRFTATFALVVAPAAPQPAGAVATSTIAVSDPQTTWAVEVPHLMTHDLAPEGAVVAQQPAAFVWPSAASPEPWPTIDWVCADVAGRTAACESDAVHDPGIAITHAQVQVDVPAQPGDAFAIRGQRRVDAAASGGGPTFFTAILDQASGTFE